MLGTGLDDVTVVYGGGGAALRHVTLMAEPGEILAVLGPSGSGKSTLLRALAGLVPVEGGDVWVAGEKVTGVPAHRRGLAMVFEEAAVIPFTDVGGNLGWGPLIRHVPQAEVAERVDEQARGLGLSRFLRRRPKTLSAGEFARVGIGRALTHTPTGFLFDEPLAHLDAAHRLQVRRRIVDVVRPLGVSSFYVTHDQSEAMAVADRVALLDAGRVVQVAAPRELYERPATIAAATFVGSPAIGLLTATPVTGGESGTDGSGFRVGSRILPLWTPLPPELRGWIGRPVVLGVRPEEVHDARGGTDPSVVTMPARVVHSENTGPDTMVTFRIVGDDGQPADLSSRLGRDPGLREGDEVPIGIDVRRVHAFDPLTGRAIRHAMA